MRQHSSSLRTQRCRLVVRGANPGNAARLFAHGTDLISVAAELEAE